MKVSIISLFFLLVTFNHSFAGDRSGNGGNGILAEIKSYQHQLEHGIRRGIVTVSGSPDAAIETIRRVNVLLGSNLVLNGSPVQAINYPHPSKPIVVFDEQAWSSLLMVQKKRLVLHEFAFLLGYDDYDYTVSSRMYDQLQQSEPERFFQSERQAEAIVFGCDLNLYKSYDGDWSYSSPRWGMNLVALALAKGCKDILEIQMQLKPSLGYCTAQKMSCFALALFKMIYLSQLPRNEQTRYSATGKALRWTDYHDVLSFLVQHDSSTKNDTFIPCMLNEPSIFAQIAYPDSLQCAEASLSSLTQSKFFYSQEAQSDSEIAMLKRVRLPQRIKDFLGGL